MTRVIDRGAWERPGAADQLRCAVRWSAGGAKVLFSISEPGWWAVFGVSLGVCLVGLRSVAWKIRTVRQYRPVDHRGPLPYILGGVVSVVQVWGLTTEVDNPSACLFKVSASMVLLPLVLYPVAGRIGTALDVKERRGATMVQFDRLTSAWLWSMALLMVVGVSARL